MLGKNSKPMIGILTGSMVLSNRSGVVDCSKILLQSKTRSPKGVKGIDFGGVGLGIVVTLEKKGDNPSEILANRALFSRSSPIPVTLPKNSSGIGGDLEEIEIEMVMESSEEYTIVTCHGPNKSYTKVYFEGIEHGRKSEDDRRTPFRIQSSIQNDRASVFHISTGEFAGIPASDFLSSCNLCQKQLHGKDVYMYREKAFCSTECRCRQIAMDERKEKCRLKASRAVDVSSSNGQFFTTGILAI